MREFVEDQLTECSNGANPATLRDEFNSAKALFRIDPEELGVYRKYDTVLSISKTEGDMLTELLKCRNVLHVPFIPPPTALANTYNGPPVLSIGPNPFNVQGYVYFVRAVMPLILRAIPSFRLIVTGSAKQPAEASRGIDWRGFVEDRATLFQEAGYAVCPVFAGTGQQVKIVEAMAHGLAVVAFEEVAQNSWLKHGKNGLIATCPEEFANHVMLLQTDANLRGKLGRAARETIRDEKERSRPVWNFAPTTSRQ
jgi:hypothetical protein